MTIWLISDTHFHHANILGFKRADGSPLRSFSNVHEMDDFMATKWAETVKPQDHVWHLGDVMLQGKNLGIIKTLPGHKRLVLGNHDNKLKITEYVAAGFEKIVMWRRFEDVVCTHVPIHPGSIGGRLIGNIHGHIHDRVLDDPRYLNVSVERTEYGPIAFETARDLLRKQVIV